MNKILNWSELNSLAVKQLNIENTTFAVYISNGLSYDGTGEKIWDFVIAEISKLYSERSIEYVNNIFSNLTNGGLFCFETRSEMEKFYAIFEQPLTDSSPIYACTYNNLGECLTENT